MTLLAGDEDRAFPADDYTGGSFGLLLVFRPLSPDEFARAVNAAWDDKLLEGPFEDPGLRKPFTESPSSFGSESVRSGWGRLTSDRPVPVNHSVVREESADYLYFDTKVGSLSRLYGAAGYPHEPAGDWYEPFADFFFDTAVRIGSAVEFYRGVINWNAEFELEFVSIPGGPLPAQRWGECLETFDGTITRWPRTEHSAYVVVG